MEPEVQLTPATEEQKKLIARVEEEAGTSINLCYQCGKCSAGCPAVFAMDYTPRRVIRLLQLNLAEEALQSESIWICATCETCSTRCPRGVNIAGLMDALRREALRRGIITDEKIAAFNKGFLNGVKHFGRNYEVGLTLQYNLATKQYFKDMDMGWPMLKRGKAGMFPHVIRGRGQVKKIFARTQKQDGE